MWAVRDAISIPNPNSEKNDPKKFDRNYIILFSGCDLFMQCVSQLVRDSREFSTLLGRMEPGTGVRRPGAIDKVCAR